MFKTSEIKKRILFLMVMILLGGTFTLICFAALGNTDQRYKDIIAEYTAIFSTNKSMEMNLLFCLIFGGIAIYFLFFLATKRKWKDSGLEVNFKEVNNSSQKSKEFLAVLVAISASILIIYGGTYQIVIASLLYAAILYMIDTNIVYTGLCVYYLSVYVFIALYRLYVYEGGKNDLNILMITILALFISIVPLAFKKKKDIMIKIGMIEEIIIPFLLLIYLTNKYQYEEEIIVVNVPDTVRIFIKVIIVIFVLEAIYTMVKKWKNIQNIDDIVTLGSCVAIMAFNRFDGTGAIMSTDLHHPFENIIGFSQVLKLGQTPFKNYIPVSGMYSIVQGAIFDIFGSGGTFANYYITNNLFYLFVIILIVALLRKQVAGSYVMILSLMFYVQSYNRLVFMLPITLLLIWPRLIEKKNTWLMIWFLTSLFQGLYYPLYGVATCIAFLPLGVWQSVTFIKSGELKKMIKNIKFWIGWIVCAIFLLLFLGYLFGTLKHTLAMSGQSVLAYGISRFGQLVPEWFFPYLGERYSFARISLYYIFTVMIPVGVVWGAFALGLKSANVFFVGKKIKVGNMRNACMMLSAVIMPIICYTFTFIRLDIDNIYARGAGVIFVEMVLILIFTWNYLDNVKLRIFLTLVMTAIPAVMNMAGIFSIDSNSKLTASYTVPEGYVYVNDSEVEKLGTGFVDLGMYNSIKNMYAEFKDKDKTFSYMGSPSLFGYFYLFDIRGDGAMELADTVKSFSAAEETIDIARANKSIIAPTFFAPYYNYYLYHWLLTSGEYVWNAETREFYPNDGMYTKEEIMRQNKNINIAWNDMEIGKVASSWGSSIETLENIFSELDINCNIRTEENHLTIDFSQTFDGDMADFIYMEFEGMESNYEYTSFNLNGEVTQGTSILAKYLMKKNYNPNMVVEIKWLDDDGETHAMNCKMSKGKLLIPIGAGEKWLFNQHAYISIFVHQDNNEIEVPEISNIRLLKLREIK